MTHRRFAILWTMLALLGPALAIAPGCAGGAISDEQAANLAELDYPRDAERGPALDIIVHTTGDRLHLTNRTASNYNNMQLWLNQQYVRRVDAVEIGTANTLPLKSFINRYREPFPTGGLLSPDKREDVVLAELYDPQANVRHPLTVREPTTE